MCSQRKSQFHAGLFVMGLALLSNVFFFNQRYMIMGVARSLQLTATGALFFGMLKAHPAHKSKFLLFWLGATTIFLTTLLYVIQDYFVEHLRFLYFYTYLILVFSAISAVGIVYMMNIIYKAYVELTEEPVNAVETVETVETMETVQTVAEDKPPTYETTINDVSIPLNS